METVRHLGLRLPEDLLIRMRAAAAADRRSLNSWAVLALERAVTEAEQDSGK
jgi:predicted HicB family RNase H-like nuclease